jgi:hypothetical protein
MLFEDRGADPAGVGINETDDVGLGACCPSHHEAAVLHPHSSPASGQKMRRFGAQRHRTMAHRSGYGIPLCICWFFKWIYCLSSTTSRL